MENRHAIYDMKTNQPPLQQAAWEPSSQPLQQMIMRTWSMTANFPSLFSLLTQSQPAKSK